MRTLSRVFVPLHPKEAPKSDHGTRASSSQNPMATQAKNEMTTTFTIRQETARDYSQVEEVVRQAFRNVQESDHREHLLVERLRKTEGYIPELSLVAETTEGQIVGHILLTEVNIVGGERAFTALAVAPLSVLPAFQRAGIGGALLREAHHRAAKLGYKATIVLGHKDYYPRFGYRKASLFGIQFPFPAPDECRMAMELVKDGLKGVHGTVRYPEAFLA